MREIPLLKQDGTIDECLVGIVQACMQCPDDIASIEEDIGAYRLWSASGFRNTRLGRHLKHNWRAAKEPGLYAGMMFYTVCMFNKHRPDLEVGMLKSALVTVLELEKHGRKFERNESTLKKYWAEYKNALHLWAALAVYLAEGFQPPLDFIRLLSIAEVLIGCGNAFVENWEPWRAPASILTLTTVEIRKPDAEDIALVERYSANGQHLIPG